MKTKRKKTLFYKLKARGEWEDTLLLLTSDH